MFRANYVNKILAHVFGCRIKVYYNCAFGVKDDHAHAGNAITVAPAHVSGRILKFGIPFAVALGMGVLAGASMPNPLDTTKSGIPASAITGTAGAAGERFAPDCTTMRRRPSRTN